MDYDRYNARRGSNSRGSETNRLSQHSDEPQWESSFSQILTRTKQNINRVNEKYGGSSSNISSRPGFEDLNYSPHKE